MGIARRIKRQSKQKRAKQEEERTVIINSLQKKFHKETGQHLTASEIEAYLNKQEINKL